MEDLRLPNPGSAFDEATGKLYLFDRSPTPDGPDGSILVVRCWPDPRAWHKSIHLSCSDRLATTNWRGIRPFFSLSEKECSDSAPSSNPIRLPLRRQRNITRAVTRVPPGVLATVRNYSPGTHWRLLNLFARVPAFLERAHAQPAVPFLVAQADRFKGGLLRRPYCAARRLQGRKARDILAWLHWPQPRSALRLLGRFDWASTSVSALLQLRQLLESGEKWVHHLPFLDSVLVSLLLDHHSVLTWGFLQEVVALESLQERRRVTQELWTMRAPSTCDEPLLAIRPINSLSEHKNRWDEWQASTLAQAQRRQEWPEAPPPPPPIPGARDPRGLGVVPLASWEAISEHGRRMENCLVQPPPHVLKLLAGRGALYEIIDRTRRGSRPPLLASAYLEFMPWGEWQLTELERPNNRPCSRAMWRRVEDWFESRDAVPGPSISAADRLDRKEQDDPECLPSDGAIPF